jgi:hypothetical protein
VAQDVVATYCLYRLHMPLGAWFYALVHIVYFYSSLYPRLRGIVNEFVDEQMKKDEFREAAPIAKINF